MATVTRGRVEARSSVIRGVDYEAYVAISDDPDRDRLRIDYLDGALEIMSPAHRHEIPSGWFAFLIHEVAAPFDAPFVSSGSSTFRKRGKVVERGAGSEADQSYYLANATPMADRADVDLDAGDPPPDLWIEVDNQSSSRPRLPIYARLGVPEVWRYQVATGSLWFGRLAGGAYVSIDRSLALPWLTPALALEGLALIRDAAGQGAARRLRARMSEALNPDQA